MFLGCFDGISLKEEMIFSLSLEGMLVAAGSEGKRKHVQALSFWRDALLLQKVLDGMQWEADSLACSRKFVLPDRCHEAKKRN